MNNQWFDSAIQNKAFNNVKKLIDEVNKKVKELVSVLDTFAPDKEKTALIKLSEGKTDVSDYPWLLTFETIRISDCMVKNLTNSDELRTSELMEIYKENK